MLVGLGLNVSLMSMSLFFGSSTWSHIFVRIGGSRHSDYLILGKSVLGERDVTEKSGEVNYVREVRALFNVNSTL